MRKQYIAPRGAFQDFSQRIRSQRFTANATTTPARKPTQIKQKATKGRQKRMYSIAETRMFPGIYHCFVPEYYNEAGAWERE
ncbi:MAG: hypothetical protein HW390_360 [Candidatus Brocadiaceae bacterium]|nr:hypothetical protein [Candidatus Brocadiaceae bacterium]